MSEWSTLKLASFTLLCLGLGMMIGAWAGMLWPHKPQAVTCDVMEQAKEK